MSLKNPIETQTLKKHTQHASDHNKSASESLAFGVMSIHQLLIPEIEQAHHIPAPHQDSYQPKAGTEKILCLQEMLKIHQYARAKANICW